MEAKAIVETKTVDRAVPPTGPGIRKKTLSERQVEEVTFWAPQFKEHALFLFLGLDPLPITIQSPLSKTLSESLQKPTAENAGLVAKLKGRCRQLYASWSAFEGMVAGGKIDVPILSNLVNHTRYIKSRIMDLQNQRVWVGPLLPEFVEHLRDELDYFVARFNDQISPDEERLFWLETNAEHLAFTAHQLNTDYKVSRPVVEQALKLSDEGMAALSALPKEPVDLLQMAELSRRFDHAGYANRTNALINGTVWNNGAPTPIILASIHPVMLEHMTREGNRAANRIAALAPASASPQMAGRTGGRAQIPHPF